MASGFSTVSGAKFKAGAFVAARIAETSFSSFFNCSKVVAFFTIGLWMRFSGVSLYPYIGEGTRVGSKRRVFLTLVGASYLRLFGGTGGSYECTAGLG